MLDKGWLIKIWHKVGLFIIPWGKTVHWYLWLVLTLGTVKANLGASEGSKGIVKKQSFKSIIVRYHLLGIIDGKRIPGCKAPTGSITALIFLRSINILQLPDFFFITKTGEFQGLVDSIICPCSLCSIISSYHASNFSLVKGHCSIYMGFSESQVSFNAVFFWSSGPRINLDFGKGYIPYWP